MVGPNANIVVSEFSRIIWPFFFFLFCQVHAKYSYKGNLLFTLNEGRQAARAPHVKGLIEGRNDLVISA